MHKLPSIFSWALLLTLALLIIGGCSTYKSMPTLKLNLESSNEEPAVLQTYCGLYTYLTLILDETGREIFNASAYKASTSAGLMDSEGYPLKVELKPGQYTLYFTAVIHSTPRFTGDATLQMESGHLYKLARYGVLHKRVWLWVEDWTTSEVVGGTPPPPDVERDWQGILEICPSTALDYL
jgi:hypothetical protein